MFFLSRCASAEQVSIVSRRGTEFVWRIYLASCGLSRQRRFDCRYGFQRSNPPVHRKPPAPRTIPKPSPHHTLRAPDYPLVHVDSPYRQAPRMPLLSLRRLDCSTFPLVPRASTSQAAKFRIFNFVQDGNLFSGRSDGVSPTNRVRIRSSDCLCNCDVPYSVMIPGFCAGYSSLFCARSKAEWWRVLTRWNVLRFARRYLRPILGGRITSLFVVQGALVGQSSSSASTAARMASASLCFEAITCCNVSPFTSTM